MTDGKIVGGEISPLGVLVDEGSVWVIENLSVTMVFHHDDKNMVEMRNPPGNRAFLSRHDAGEYGQQAHSKGDFFYDISWLVFDEDGLGLGNRAPGILN